MMDKIAEREDDVYVASRTTIFSKESSVQSAGSEWQCASPRFGPEGGRERTSCISFIIIPTGPNGTSTLRYFVGYNWLCTKSGMRLTAPALLLLR